MEGWASNSQCDQTDRRQGQGQACPQGETEPLVWDQQRTWRAQTPPQTFPATSSSRALPPHQLSPTGPAVPWRPAGGAKPPLRPRAPRTWLWQCFSSQRPPLP